MLKKKSYMGLVSFVLVFVFIMSTEARAVIYPFEPIYGDAPENAPPSVADQMALQLSLGIEEGPEAGQVEFIFYNNLAPGNVVDGEPSPGIITGVFFEDGFLDSMGIYIPYSDDGDPAINFVDTTSTMGSSAPWGLPFGTGHSFEAESKPGVKPGVEPDEGVGIVFNTSGDISDIYDALAQGFAENLGGNSLRIGIHVQNYGEDNEYSDAFVLVPVPGAVLLGILGLGVAGLKLRKYA